jgi:hypothetical protein
VLPDEFTEAQPFVQFPDQDETSVGSDAWPLKIHLQRSIERKLKGLILFDTYAV